MLSPKVTFFRWKNSVKRFQAQADVGINSPSQANTQSVNVNIFSPLMKDQTIQITTDEEHKERKELEVKERDVANGYWRAKVAWIGRTRCRRRRFTLELFLQSKFLVLTK